MIQSLKIQPFNETHFMSKRVAVSSEILTLSLPSFLPQKMICLRMNEHAKNEKQSTLNHCLKDHFAYFQTSLSV